MGVSDRHLRRGVAGMIVRNAIEQAKAHDLASIYLSTSSMQEAAVNLYLKHGWIVEKRREGRLLGAKAHAVCMRLHLRDKSSL